MYALFEERWDLTPPFFFLSKGREFLQVLGNVDGLRGQSIYSNFSILKMGFPADIHSLKKGNTALV